MENKTVRKRTRYATLEDAREANELNSKNYRETHREHYREYQREYRKKHPEKVKESKDKYNNSIKKKQLTQRQVREGLNYEKKRHRLSDEEKARFIAALPDHVRIHVEALNPPKESNNKGELV